MPRVRRREKRFRGGLTGAQRELLLYGVVLLDNDGEGFETEQAERRAWRAYRADLMAEWREPGRRPHAYWRHDIGLDPAPVHWWQELRELEARGLLDRDEEARVERAQPELDPQQPENFLDPRWCETNMRGTEGRELRREVDRAEFVAGWHARRGRAEVAAKYSRRAEIISQKVAQFAPTNTDLHARFAERSGGKNAGTLPGRRDANTRKDTTE